MKHRHTWKVMVAFTVLLALAVPSGADEPLDHRVSVPIVMRNWSPGYAPDNLLCNPSFELAVSPADDDALCWYPEYPGTGNRACDGDGKKYPKATDGRCLLRTGCWPDMQETYRSSTFHLEALTAYELVAGYQIWSDDFGFDDEDVASFYLVDDRDHHLFLFDLKYEDQVYPGWLWKAITVSPGRSGLHYLLVVTATDDEGLTCFYFDALQFWYWGDCLECVSCQLYDEPPIEVCDQGTGEDCNGCCPTGNDCAGLAPQCPVTKPPLPPYRVVARRTECHQGQVLTLDMEPALDMPEPTLWEVR